MPAWLKFFILLWELYTLVYSQENVFPIFYRWTWPIHHFKLSGKKSKSVFDFLTYSRETWFSFSYVKVEALEGAIDPSNEIDRVSKFDNSLSFGAKQKSLGQIFFELWFFKDFFTKNLNWIFFDFLWFQVGSIKKCIDVCLSMQIQENMFLSVAAHWWGCFWVF